ncbi:hypothetical protein FPOAC2_08999 [Fusarium poae]|jgi:hypothetical protein|uniref:hypothetical protein n=1 Tax=Fusarium poae TaxID=36050 RepID=UPI001CEB4054|nr:hypothetical protein FPOAC1_009057 [Fusarium poae]KAG8669658.1 hypothetical protein FPOAC1_009057 [Fusarium poae]
MGLRGRYFEDDGKNHTLGVLLFTHLFGFMSEWSKHRLDGNETIAALDRLTIDEIAKSPSYSMPRTGEDTRLFKDLLLEYTGEDAKTKKPGKVRGMVDYIREANRKS